MKKQIYVAVLLLGWSSLFVSCNEGYSRNNKNDGTKEVEYRPVKDTVCPEMTCKSILNRLYNDYVFGSQYDQFEQVVDEFFTAKAKQKLIDAYDYDCDGVCYAFWTLRTDGQDGKDGADGSHVDFISQAVGNAYEVQYVDMGWHGFTLFLFAFENGDVKIDDFVKILDESIDGFGSWSDGAVEININGIIDQIDYVVSDDGDYNSEGEYVFTEGDHYIVVQQDYLEVPIAGHHMETYSAENGDGVIYTFRSRVNVREAPSTNSAVVAIMPTSIDMMEMEGLPCLGKVDGWYKTRINGQIGYVREDLARWALSEF